MESLDGMQELRVDPQGHEGCHELFRDMARLAHSDEDGLAMSGLSPDDLIDCT